MGGIRGESTSEIIIGDYCQFEPNVVIMTSDDAVNGLQDSMPGRIVIGDDCWIWANVTITRGITIGKGSVRCKQRGHPEYLRIL